MRIAKVRDVKTPTRGTPGSAGLDFYVPEDFGTRILFPSSDILIPSGVKADLPKGTMLIGVDKSGVATSKLARYKAGMPEKKDGFESSVIVGAKLIDEDYQGEIHIHLINIGLTPITIKPGMKIAQFVIVPIIKEDVIVVDADHLFLEATDRGAGSFGSTGTY